ncbi:hypothetical protein AVEN_273200-1 [Araneus ventricosus]|uniref:Uncharacterized protein n=1 Tax=Araneus ventricosus TaxID=182803 RepID=A0A4Y2GU45_ARAVE|nr:hypothetical protein AVEN_273200-1 [Araneus ventricosus]
MTVLFWITNKLKRCQFQDISTQTVLLKKDAFIQVQLNQLFEKSTQTLENKCNASTQVEQSQFEANSTQTVSEIMLDKDVQTFVKTSENTETQASACLCLDKKVQMAIIPNSIGPFKKQTRKPTIPLTTDFLKFLERKYDILIRNIELTAKVDVISKDEGHVKVPESCELLSHDELEIQASAVDKDIIDRNSSKLSSLESGNSVTVGIRVFMEDEMITANEPVPFKHEYAHSYVKLCEDREKQNEPSILKKQFQKLKKLLKI